MTIIDKRVIHSGSLKAWKWRRPFASNTIPAVGVWIRICPRMENSRAVEIARFYDCPSLKVVAAESGYRTHVRGS